MPNFANPFQGNVTKQLSPEELVRAIRLDIASEQEAIFLYEAHADATPDPRAQKVLRDIAKEEKVHVHELQALLKILDPEEKYATKEGEEETKHNLSELTSSDNEKAASDAFIEYLASQAK